MAYCDLENIFESPVTTNDVIMTSSPKTTAKFGFPRNQTLCHVVRKDLVRAIQIVLFIELEPLCQKLWALMSYSGLFYHAHSSDMVMSRDPSCTF